MKPVAARRRGPWPGSGGDPIAQDLDLGSRQPLLAGRRHLILRHAFQEQALPGLAGNKGRAAVAATEHGRDAPQVQAPLGLHVRMTADTAVGHDRPHVALELGLIDGLRQTDCRRQERRDAGQTQTSAKSHSAASAGRVEGFASHEPISPSPANGLDAITDSMVA